MAAGVSRNTSFVATSSASGPDAVTFSHVGRNGCSLIAYTSVLVISVGCKHSPTSSSGLNPDAAPVAASAPEPPPPSPEFKPPLTPEERMARMSSFAFARESPEPESDSHVGSDTEVVCGRYKRGDFNSWGQIAVFSRRWLGIMYRMEIPDPRISHCASGEAARLMRRAARHRGSQCSEAIAAAIDRTCPELPDAGGGAR